MGGNVQRSRKTHTTLKFTHKIFTSELCNAFKKTQGAGIPVKETVPTWLLFSFPTGNQSLVSHPKRQGPAGMG